LITTGIANARRQDCAIRAMVAAVATVKPTHTPTGGNAKNARATTVTRAATLATRTPLSISAICASANGNGNGAEKIVIGFISIPLVNTINIILYIIINNKQKF
jgi:hypothetical protein